VKQFISIKQQITPTYNQLKISYTQTHVHKNADLPQISHIV